MVHKSELESTAGEAKLRLITSIHWRPPTWGLSPSLHYIVGVRVLSGKKEKCYFNIWTEHEGQRGSLEVCSALTTFLDMADV